MSAMNSAPPSPGLMKSTESFMASMKELEERSKRMETPIETRLRSSSLGHGYKAQPSDTANYRSRALSTSQIAKPAWMSEPSTPTSVTMQKLTNMKFKDVPSRLHQPTKCFESSTWKNTEKTINSARKSVKPSDHDVTLDTKSIHTNPKPFCTSANVTNQVLPGNKRQFDVRSKLYNSTVASQSSSWVSKEGMYSPKSMRSLGVGLDAISTDFDARSFNEQRSMTSDRSSIGVTTPDANIRASLLLPTQAFLSSVRAAEERKKNPPVDISDDPWWDLRGSRQLPRYSAGGTEETNRLSKSYTEDELDDVISRLSRPTVATKAGSWNSPKSKRRSRRESSSNGQTSKSVTSYDDFIAPTTQLNGHAKSRPSSVSQSTDRLTRPTKASLLGKWIKQDETEKSHGTGLSTSRPTSSRPRSSGNATRQSVSKDKPSAHASSTTRKQTY